MLSAHPRPGRARWGLLAPLVLLLAVEAAAQGRPATTPAATPEGIPYRLRCDAARAELCAGVVRAFRIRGTVVARVGDALGAYRPEPRDVLVRAAAPGGAGIELVLVAAEATELRTVVEPPDDAEAAVRAVVLGIEALVDLDAAPASRGRTAGPFFRERELGTLPDVPRGTGVRTWRDRRPRTAFARPIVYGRVLGGLSLERGAVLLGPGLGFGLCVVGQCAVLEADLSLVPVKVEHDGLRVDYTAVTFSMRVLLRPLVFGPLSFAVTVGALARLGSASTSEGVSRTVTDAGFRGTLEAAYRIVGPVEIVLEGGLDVLVQRARFIRGEDAILLEDATTPWLVLGGRVRP